MRRADGARERAARSERIDDDDRGGAAQTGALHAELAHAPGADHDDHIPGGDLARGSDAGQRGAPEQGRLGRGQLVRELEHAARRHHDALGERADRGHAIDRLAVGREARRAVRQGACADPRPQRQAGGRPAGLAGTALAAGRRPREDHAVAHREVAHVRPHGLDHARALVAEHHRPRSHPLALDHVQVGAADADRVDAHQRVGRSRPLEIDRADDERGARRLEERRAHPHGPVRGARQSAAAISDAGAISHSHVSA